jgi:ribosomal protein S20
LNGFTHISSFTSVEVDDINFDDWNHEIVTMKKSPTQERLEELSHRNIEEFKILSGTKTQIKNVMKILASYDHEKFEKFLKSLHHKTTQAQEEPLPSTSTAQSQMSRSIYMTPKKLTSLDKNIDYKTEILKRALNILRVADPNLNPEIAIEKLSESELNEKFAILCPFCHPDMHKKFTVSAYISQGYLRYGFKSFIDHLKSHEVQNKNIQFAEVIKFF